MQPKGRNRNEINLSDDVLSKLKKMAMADRRTLKNYIEKILIDYVKDASKKD